MTLSLSSEPQARSLTNREITQEWNNARLRAKGMCSAYIRVKEVRGQVPGTTRNGARTNSAINNSQNSGYVRAPEYYAIHWGSGAPVLRHQAPRAVDPILRRQYRDATCWRHMCSYCLCVHFSILQIYLNNIIFYTNNINIIYLYYLYSLFFFVFHSSWYSQWLPTEIC